jgi:hypothetical protein
MAGNSAWSRQDATPKENKLALSEGLRMETLKDLGAEIRMPLYRDGAVLGKGLEGAVAGVPAICRSAARHRARSRVLLGNVHPILKVSPASRCGFEI